MADETMMESAPILEDILPTPAGREAFESRLAALEAAELVRILRRNALAVDGTLGIGQAELAHRVGVKPADISDIEEAAIHGGPNYGLLRRIAFACGFDWTRVLQFIIAEARAAASDSVTVAAPAAPAERAVAAAAPMFVAADTERGDDWESYRVVLAPAREVTSSRAPDAVPDVFSQLDNPGDETR